MAFSTAATAALTAATAAAAPYGGFATFLSIGSTLLGAGIQSGASKYQEEVAKVNAQIADQNAERLSAASQIQQQDADNEARLAIGALEAQQGASGIDIGSRSSVLTRRNARVIARKNALTIRDEGDQAIRNEKRKAEDFRNQARAEKSVRRGILFNTGLNVTSSLVSGATKFKKNRTPTLKSRSLAT